MKKEPKPQPHQKWHSLLLIDIYECAKIGMTLDECSVHLGLAPGTVRKWGAKDWHPEVRVAWRKGREARVNPRRTTLSKGNSAAFVDHVFGSLPPPLRKKWEQVEFWNSRSDGYAKIESLLEDGGTRVRQKLFAYALVACDFDMNAALLKLKIKTKTFKEWLDDPDFHDLMHELKWHQMNFFESAFMKLVASGDKSAIVHAAKTMLADRGYGDKLHVQHSGTVNHIHSAIPVQELNLPLEVRKEVLAAVRALKEKQMLEQNSAPALPQHSKVAKQAEVVDIE